MIESRANIFFPETNAASAAMPALDAVPNPVISQGDAPADNGGMTVVGGSGIVAPHNPEGVATDNYTNGLIVTYTVKPGDTPSEIAQAFGISLNTLLWANDISNAGLIRVGDRLVILPISGVQVEVKKGDTIDSIAKKYKGNIQDILSFNGLSADEQLAPGETILIPDGELQLTAPAPSGASPSRSFANFPYYAGYYMRPIIGGVKTQGIHGYNAVDLADSCGTPIYASASGTVLIAKMGAGWNGGYGNYVVIAHPNGTQTLYAHVQAEYVWPGLTVTQGQHIADIGNTGNTTAKYAGHNGCHVHFEIRGARNPF